MSLYSSLFFCSKGTTGLMFDFATYTDIMSTLSEKAGLDKTKLIECSRASELSTFTFWIGGYAFILERKSPFSSHSSNGFFRNRVIWPTTRLTNFFSVPHHYEISIQQPTTSSPSAAKNAKSKSTPFHRNGKVTCGFWENH